MRLAEPVMLRLEIKALRLDRVRKKPEKPSTVNGRPYART
jgi:hypothetical protein